MYRELETGFSAREVAAICRVTDDDLDHWESVGLVEPSLGRPPGLRRGRYSYRDVLWLEIIRILLEWGASLDQVQRACCRIRVGLEESMRDTCMTVLDGELLVFTNRDEARCFAESDPARRVWVVDATQISDDLDEGIRDVCPDYFEPEPWQDACHRYEVEAQVEQFREFLDTVHPADFDF